ncbi:MAG: hypothetical protein AB1656_17820 [Candidatus Omnitrophota bacterium]
MSNNLSETFIEKCLKGSALLDEIDDYIDAWREDESGEEELYEFLGMTKEEYSLWVTDPDVLPFIVMARKQQVDIAHILAKTKVG